MCPASCWAYFFPPCRLSSIAPPHHKMWWVQPAATTRCRGRREITPGLGWSQLLPDADFTIDCQPFIFCHPIMREGQASGPKAPMCGDTAIDKRYQTAEEGLMCTPPCVVPCTTRCLVTPARWSITFLLRHLAGARRQSSRIPTKFERRRAHEQHRPPWPDRESAHR